ncbi:tRNA 2-thiouridine(34) synthase MnmA [Patescibacteria group bacterium]|nr:tRNA 2-thiouridine(34) synthase MnmA [Patescibacteria group bacterium]
MKNKKVAVAVSGGVDSSVSAKLLKDQGYDVIGIYMHLGFENESAEKAAKNVCDKLGIKFIVEDISESFKREVIDYFVDSYKKGLTPNPCVKCNKAIKFGTLLEMAKKHGVDFLATGHYLQKRYSKYYIIHLLYKYLVQYFNIKKEHKLFISKDSLKDQTYFLYNLNQEILDKIMFPVGSFKKSKIKKIAEKANLPTLKQESQDICFLSGDHNIFLKEHLEDNPGPIKKLNGEEIGQHNGLYFYTIGQRRGIDIGGSGPYYVAKLDYKSNTLYVVNSWNHEILYRKELIAKEVNFLKDKAPSLPYNCQAVIRYGHAPVGCNIFKDEKGDGYMVIFKEKQRAVTLGQSIAFYQGRELVGGGIIDLDEN